MLELSNAEIFRLMAHTYLNGRDCLNLKQFCQKIKRGKIADLGNVRMDYLKISLLSNSSGLAIVPDSSGDLVITKTGKVSICSKRKASLEIFKKEAELSFSFLKKDKNFVGVGNYVVSKIIQNGIGAASFSYLGKGEIFFSPFYVFN
ncbi:MAG: hypothetical protein ACOCUF_02670 [Patescibacteria group bacterium]